MKTLLSAIPLFFLLSPAEANWQYTFWGSTPDDVIKASNGRAIENTNRGRDMEGYRTLLKAPYQSGPFSFTAYFVFDLSGHLKFVDLETISVDCTMLLAELSNTYGPPADRGSFGLRKWWDKTNGNAVVYSEFKNCELRYMEIPASGAPGKL